MSTTQLGNAKRIIDDNYEENPNSFLHDFCHNSFFSKEKGQAAENLEKRRME